MSGFSGAYRLTGKVRRAGASAVASTENERKGCSYAYIFDGGFWPNDTSLQLILLNNLCDAHDFVVSRCIHELDALSIPAVN